MTTLVVHPADRPLVGSVPVPSDASIARLSLLFAGIADGRSRLVSFSATEGPLTTAACLRTLGVSVVSSERDVVISGVGTGGLRPPEGPLDCGADGATMHLLTGLLAATSFRSSLVADAVLGRTPMTELVAALTSRGAVIEGAARDDGPSAPVTATVGPLPSGRRLSKIEYDSAVASADLKSALLISGLLADGVTLFKEPMVSRDHAERLLDVLGAPIRTIGTLVRLDPSEWAGRIPAFEVAIPGDLSAAVFPLAAAQLVPGSQVTTRGVGVNPTRSGFLEIARDMGAGLTIEPQGERHGEPVAALHGWSAPLRAASMGGETVFRATQEIPIACALAARAGGTSRFVLAEGDLAEGNPASDETDARLVALLRMLRAFDVVCDARAGVVEIEGREAPLRAARIASGGDPAIAMTAAVLALVARGTTRVEGAECIAGPYPKFVATMRALGARIDVEA
jgi:3-phosphoshikimate 1-carboxyvinyltransferase